MQVLDIDRVSMSFDKKRAILKNFSLSLDKGKILVLLGASGSGKSTVLRIIAGLQDIDEGSISINNELVNGKNTFVNPEHRNIAFVFQDYALLPHLSVKDNILFANSKANLNELLDICQISDLINRYPHQLSGGQQQRLAFARALSLNPSLLLLDEPFSNVDRHLKKSLQEDLLSLVKSLNISTILVTHDINEAFYIADKIAVLKEGCIEQLSSPFDIYHKPKTSFIANFIGGYNIIDESKSFLFGIKNTKIAIAKEKIFFLKKENNLKAKVVSKVFLGAYYEFKLEIKGLVLNVNSKDHLVNKGDDIYLDIEKNDIIELKK